MFEMIETANILTRSFNRFYHEGNSIYNNGDRAKALTNKHALEQN